MIGQTNDLTNLYCEISSVQINLDKQTTTSAGSKKAFTLIELLVVISILGLLMGILMPVLIASRSQGRQIVCSGNIKQLILAGTAYSGENAGSFVPAASDIFSDNRHRWYGVRDNIDNPFDSAKGPLATYLSQGFLKCPTKVNFLALNPSHSDYDAGSGGYGYNMIYIGSRIWADGYEDHSCEVSTKDSEVRKPAQTLIFADTAMASHGRYIEYSFAEPRYFVVNGAPVTDAGWNPTPSIHFRHRRRASVGWVDAHVTSERMADYDGINPDGTAPAGMNLSWFAPMDNSLFDLK
jgi:prepilin-type N-terminal cleavage/methylation domain-containing protein